MHLIGGTRFYGHKNTTPAKFSEPGKYYKLSIPQNPPAHLNHGLPQPWQIESPLLFRLASPRPLVPQTLLILGIGVVHLTRRGEGSGHLQRGTDVPSVRHTAQVLQLSGAPQTDGWSTYDPGVWPFMLFGFPMIYLFFYSIFVLMTPLMLLGKDRGVWFSEWCERYWVGLGIYLLLWVLEVIVGRKNRIREEAESRVRGLS